MNQKTETLCKHEDDFIIMDVLFKTTWTRFLWAPSIPGHYGKQWEPKTSGEQSHPLKGFQSNEIQLLKPKLWNMNVGVTGDFLKAKCMETSKSEICRVEWEEAWVQLWVPTKWQGWDFLRVPLKNPERGIGAFKKCSGHPQGKRRHCKWTKSSVEITGCWHPLPKQQTS